MLTTYTHYPHLLHPLACVFSSNLEGIVPFKIHTFLEYVTLVFAVCLFVCDLHLVLSCFVVLFGNRHTCYHHSGIQQKNSY